MFSFDQKVLISLFSAVLFVLVSLPQTYQVTNFLTKNVGQKTVSNGCPTVFGLLLHTLVFVVLSFYSMRDGRPFEEKMRNSLCGGLIFLALANPMTYKLVRKVLKMVADSDGCPTLKGVLVHGAAYGAVLRAMMEM